MSTPTLLPLKYCSIERAARMLKVEVEDIEHWIITGAISACIEIKHHIQYEKSEDSLSFDLDIDSGSQYSYFTFDSLENGKHVYHISGLWRIINLGNWFDEDTDILEDVSIAVCYPQRYCDDYYLSYLYPYEIKKGDLLIVHDDLVRLHEALYNEGDLWKVRKEERSQGTLVPRTNSDTLYKSLGLMAHLLAKQMPKYRAGSKPNASMIVKDIESVLDSRELMDMKEDMKLSNLRHDLGKAAKLLIK